MAQIYFSNAKAKGREFIDLTVKFSIDRDLYFNTYSPDYRDPFWKATIKIYWRKKRSRGNAIIENNIIGNYRKNVLFELTEGGSIEISVTHADPQKASYYANNFMKEIRQIVEEESNAAQALRLNYLSETLADALQDMEEAQKNLKNYARENSLMAEENFISDSLRLDQIFGWKSKLKKKELLSIIEDYTRAGNLDNNSRERPDQAIHLSTISSFDVFQDE